MATTIQIKRSGNVTAPSITDLLEGELAYSYDKSNNGAGAKLYIEVLDSGNGETIHTIGGKYYTSRVDAATSANTVSTLVARDSLGNFSANTITANSFVGDITATSAQKLTTARRINLGGDLQGNVLFDGTTDVTIVANVISNSVALGTDTTGDYVANLTAGTGVTLTGQAGESSNITVSIGQAVGTSADVTFNSVTSRLYGQANTATALHTGRYINLSGDVTGSAYFDGTGNADISAIVIQANSVALGTDTTGNYVGNVTSGNGIIVSGTTGENWTPNLTLSATGVTATTYGGTTNIPVFTVDQWGRLTSASNAAISTSFTLVANSGTPDTFNSGDTLRITGSTGINTIVSDNTISIVNTGVTGVATGFGLSTSAANGSITLNNTGVTRLTAGTGIEVDATSGNVTLTNLGVTSITGTANEIEVSGANAAITIGLPDNVTIGNTLTVTGDLIVLGNATTLNTATLTVEDPLVKFGNANPSDGLDIGFFGEYTNSGTKYAGLFRDASDTGKFKLFTDLTSQPTTNVITTADYTVATLVSNLSGGTVSGLSANIAVGDGGTGRGTLTTNSVLYGAGTSQVGLAAGTSGQVLQINGSGVPVFGGIDGGTY